jgi:hypothetical protein
MLCDSMDASKNVCYCILVEFVWLENNKTVKMRFRVCQNIRN